MPSINTPDTTLSNVALIEQLEIIRFLVRKGANMDHKHNNSYIPAIKALKGDNYHFNS